MSASHGSGGRDTPSSINSGKGATRGRSTPTSHQERGSSVKAMRGRTAKDESMEDNRPPNKRVCIWNLVSSHSSCHLVIIFWVVAWLVLAFLLPVLKLCSQYNQSINQSINKATIRMMNTKLNWWFCTLENNIISTVHDHFHNLNQWQCIFHKNKR